MTLSVCRFVLSIPSFSRLPVLPTPVRLSFSWADHIALIIELLGPVPRKQILAGKYSKDFFTKKGKEL